MRKGISVILPAYNERRNLESLLPALLDSGWIDECIIVEDPSEDLNGHADSLVHSLQSRYGSRIQYQKNPERIGLARSLAAGISLASYSHCLVRDSDWNHEMALTPRFRELLEGNDFVVASRYVAGRPKLLRTNDFFSLLLSRFLWRLFGSITDWTFGYFLFRRALLDPLPVEAIFQGRGEYTLRLYRALLRQGVTPLEIPTRVQERGFGTSTTSLFRHGMAYLRALLERCPRPIRTQYEEFADRYGASAAGSGHSFFGWRARRKLIDRFREPGQHDCLDLGCGNGYVGQYWLKGRKLSLTGIDFAENALKLARGTGIYREIRKLDLRTDSIAGTFGTILCIELLQYIPSGELGRFFSRLAECTQPGARLYLIAPNRESALHRWRRLLLGRSHEDYRYEHDFGAVKDALEASGFQVEQSHGASYFWGRTWSSPRGSAPPSWCFVYGIISSRRTIAGACCRNNTRSARPLPGAHGA